MDEDRKRVCMEEKGNLEIVFEEQYFLAKTGTSAKINIERLPAYRMPKMREHIIKSSMG